jgi:hypothetical protein
VTGNKEEWMKYICLGYIEPGKIEGMTEDERHAMLDDCFEYNDHLRANGHLVAEVPNIRAMFRSPFLLALVLPSR